MPRRMIEVDGERWLVSVSGHYTQYNKDEFGLVFTRGEGPGREQRIMRYVPRMTKQRETSLAQLTDAELARFLRLSQPSWTSPELGYRR
ncbi:MAG TPA: hypothetical protein VFS40_03420 [Gemmatimonadales bacterium]|nr:hypothetical protein [Gemmatimonadales bacterium]